MIGSPPANPVHVCRALEVVGISRLAQPPLLAGALADCPALRLVAVPLPAPVTGVRYKRIVAMQAVGTTERTGHRPEEDAPTPLSGILGDKGRRRKRRKKR